MLEDKLLLKVAEEIDNRFTRTQYENLLVETGLYSLSTLKDNEEYYKRTKQNLILDTLRLADDPDLIISEAHRKRRFSKELIALLKNEDVNYEKEDATPKFSPGSTQQAENHQRLPEYKKQQFPKSSEENLTNKSIKEKLRPTSFTTDKVDNTSVFFIVIPIVVVLIALLLVVMQIWDWTVALGVSALVITALAYINDLLKPKINQETATRGIRKYALIIFLALVVVFFVALIINLQRSTSDLTKQIIELNQNYDAAVSTLSVQQRVGEQKQEEINRQSTQINEMKSTLVVQSTYVTNLERTATKNADKMLLLEATARVSLPTATQMPAATPTASLILPFEDDFNNGLRPEWDVVSGEPMIVSGRVGRTSGILRLSLGDTTLSNYILEFDFYGVRNNCANCLFIEMLIGTDTKYYVVGGAVGGLYSRLDVFDDGQWRNLLSSSTSKDAHVKLQFTGNRINLFLNSTPSEPIIYGSEFALRGPIIITLDRGEFIDNFSIANP